MLAHTHRWAILGIAALLAALQPASAQLLYGRGKQEEPYTNYAYESYRAYEGVVFGRDRAPKFDQMGQFVMRGIDVFELQEYRTIAPSPGSIISKPARYQSYLNRLVIGDDQYRGVNSRFIIGDRIRAKFTSLTLDMAVMNGMRLDNHWKGGSLILLASRVDRPIFESLQDKDQRTHGDLNSTTRPRWATYLLGGDLRSQLPGLDAGISWVNQYRTDSMKKLSDNGLKGTLPTTGSPPEWIVVRISDQDPTDDVGVRVRRAALSVNGRQLDHVLGPYDRLDPDALTLTVTRHEDRTVIPLITKSGTDLLIEFPHVDPTPQGYYETEGDGSLVLWFRVPSVLAEANGDSTIVNRAYVDMDLSGDYLVEMSEVFAGASSNPATYFYTAAQATGRPDNLDDYRRVRVDYGRETARTLLSGHVDLEVRGFSLHTEYVRNFSFRAYPALLSTQLDHIGDQSAAWFVNAHREFGVGTRVGGEVFSVDPDYTTVLNVQDDTYSTYTNLLNSPFSFPTTYREPRLDKGLDATYTIEFNSVDDNDDKDQYPDSYFIRKTENLTTGGRYLSDPDGVFPGLDADLNGRPDVNENLNRIPDYYEPFLLYKVDPDAYDFGPDANNNGVIDDRENDIKPDYPYDSDRRGYHAYVEQDLQKGLKLRLGYHKTWAPAAGGRAKVGYGQLEYRRRIPYLVEVYAAERLKRIHDGIRDDVFGLGRDPIYLQPEPVPLERLTADDILNPLGQAVLIRDPLLRRNSWVNTAYVEARWLQVPNLNLSLKLKHDRNAQEEGSLQADNVISDLATVAKADYVWNPWRQLLVRPQVKWMRQRLRDDEGAVVEIDESFFYPILRLEYPVSSRTSIKAGAQGFPVLLRGLYRNNLVDDVDFDSEVYLVQVGNTSTYLGYEVNVNLGWEKRIRDFKHASRASQSEEFDRIFLRVIAGLRPLF